MIAAVVRRDRIVVIAGLVLIAALAWAYLLAGAGMDMDMDMSMPMPWTPFYGFVMFLMWWIMMIAMMLPSAAPMILLFATVNRNKRSRGSPIVPTGVFTLGYLVTWAGFSLAATLVHWLLDRSGLLSADMATAAGWLGGLILIAAGIYQMTPLKYACLRQCRNPFDFVVNCWRPGQWGAFRMGFSHGIYCVGCCWVMMGLLFYGGVMSLYWIVALSVIVLIEKVLPKGDQLGWLTGLVLIGWGILVLI